jgi:hypothetical protein
MAKLWELPKKILPQVWMSIDFLFLSILNCFQSRIAQAYAADQFALHL